jgi:exopolysaccharide biosynthesis polyprenyl glycosylphosphotransferase
MEFFRNMTSAQRRRILVDALKLFDLGVMIVAFALATVPASGVGRTISAAEFFSMRVKLGNLIIFLGLLLFWHLLFSAFGLYGSHRLSSRISESFDIVKATALSAGVVLVAASLFHIRMVSLRYLALFFAFSTGLLVVSRLILRFLLVQTRLRGRNLRNVLIVGTSKRAIDFADRLESNAELGYSVIGFADQHWDGIHHLQQGGKSLLCDLHGLPQFLRSNIVDEVVIALPIRSFHDDASRVAAVCEQQGIIVRVLPNIFDLKMARSRAEEMEGDSVITHYTGVIEGWPVVIKRMLDFSLALMALILVSPVMLLAAALIKMTSPGPVFFTQKRIGQNKRKFTIYKFRSMFMDAEAKIRQLEHLNEVSGPVFKIKDDPRITPVGKFLRKMSIDELPQLLNVLKGDMSLVGPRPLPIRDYEGFSQDWHRRRFSVRPGITCLWQVNGRSSIPFEKWMELDMQYIDKWSLWLDLKILARTIPAVLKGFGAA